MKILISSYTGLGNFVLKTPMIYAIRKEYPNAIIDIITDHNFGVESILLKNNVINNILILRKNGSILSKIVFFKRLREAQYDAVLLPFDAQPLFLILGSYIGNIKQRAMHFIAHQKKRSIFTMLMPWTICVQVLSNRHEIDLNYDLLEGYLNKPIKRCYQTNISNTKNKDILDRFELEKNKYIVLQVGVANGMNSSKKWHIDNFSNLIKTINTKYSSYKVVIVGDRGDNECDIKLLNNKEVLFVNTAGLTSVDEVINLLFFSKLVVAHDSGIMHLANSLNCNLIALYGPTDYTRTRPLSDKATMLYSMTECFCKMYNFGGSETDLLDEYPNCMGGISVKNVIDEIDRIIRI
jgi:ADP-heptose:LPS heptosyltransferase